MTAQVQTKPQKIIIRIAKTDDIEDIFNIRKTTWLATYINEKLGITEEDILSIVGTLESRERIRMKIEKDPRRFHMWIAREGEKIVAFCHAFRTAEGGGALQQRYVLPSHQGRGMGGRVLKRCLAWFGPTKQVHLTIASYNKKAMKFYKRRGFLRSRKKNEGMRLPDGTILPQIEMILVPKTVATPLRGSRHVLMPVGGAKR